MPSQALLDAAWRLRGRMVIYDAAYAALAEGLDVPLVTLDRRLARVCTSMKVKAFLPDDPRLTAVLEAAGPASKA